MSDVVVRRAAAADLPILGRLGAELMRVHFAFDPDRFMDPGPDPEAGYAWFLGTELAREDTVIFVAVRDSEVLGYVYAGIEPESWKELRETAGFVHDIVVASDTRRRGVATALMEAATEWLKGKGVPRVILWTAEDNQAAQTLFERMGFRRTMVEMTKEL